jgi:hypothetical protein
MTFVLLKNYDHYAIVNDDANFIVGRVHPFGGQPYRVTSRIGPSYQPDDIGVVKSLDDAIPTFIDYYEKNPVPWEPESSAFYSRYTMFVCLWIEQHEQGHWLAYRNDYPLLRDGQLAHFATHVDAQHAADTHELDGYPNAKAIDDGLSWQPDPEIGWCSIPHGVEERTNS